MNFGKNKKKRKLLIEIVKTNKKIFKQQEKLVNRYEYLSKKQIKEERLNKLTRYLALGFIISRIIIFIFNNFHNL